MSIATAWVGVQVKRARTEAHFHFAGRARRWVRRAAVSLTALITASNFVALFFLLRALLGGHAVDAKLLLFDTVIRRPAALT